MQFTIVDQVLEIMAAPGHKMMGLKIQLTPIMKFQHHAFKIPGFIDVRLGDTGQLHTKWG
jgi:hypothetical protein